MEKPWTQHQPRLLRTNCIHQLLLTESSGPTFSILTACATPRPLPAQSMYMEAGPQQKKQRRMQEIVVEVCIDSLAGARAAQASGADRVELCSDLVEGGITPSWGLIEEARSVLGEIPLMVLIRPRGGDFVYSEDELEVMLADIRACHDLGVHGVVLGCLQPDGSVDTASTCQLVEEAQQLDLDVTFHRAFDVCKDLTQALEDIIALGIPRVLTSGGCPSAQEGSSVLAQLVKQAAGRISIMAGGGVRSANAAALLQATGVHELHSSAKRRTASTMVYRRPHMHLSAAAAPSDYEWNVTDAAELQQLVTTVRQC